MAKIELSPGSINPYVTRLMNKDTPSSQKTASVAGLLTGSNSNDINDAHTVIRIMKGVMPSNFNELVDFTSRQADALIKFNAYTYLNNGNSILSNFGPTVANINPATIQTDYVKALATGTATWFWWTVKEQAGNALYHQIIGEVGAAGSGQDLEIPDTNVIVGLAYRITNLKLLFPTTWTY